MKLGWMLGALTLSLALADAAAAQGYCREYSQSVSIGGQRQSTYGMACMQPDGSWQVISNSGGANGINGGYGYYPPAPAPVYVPTPVPLYRPASSFSLSIGVPYYRGRGGCDEWGRGGYGRHHHGWNHGRW